MCDWSARQLRNHAMRFGTQSGARPSPSRGSTGLLSRFSSLSGVTNLRNDARAPEPNKSDVIAARICLNSSPQANKLNRLAVLQLETRAREWRRQSERSVVRLKSFL